MSQIDRSATKGNVAVPTGVFRMPLNRKLSNWTTFFQGTVDVGGKVEAST
jgi:hypothetical protein